MSTLLLRIMRRMRETYEGRLPEGALPVHPEDVAVIYVDPIWSPEHCAGVAPE